MCHVQRWSYGINLTLIGNAVYTSMDIPDTFLALSKLLNYMRMERMKIVTFVIFMAIWTYAHHLLSHPTSSPSANHSMRRRYFRHYLNLVILWSVYNEFDLMPETSKRWAPEEGVWMVWWMKWQIFVPILLLQALNLFWYYLILRIAYR